MAGEILTRKQVFKEIIAKQKLPESLLNVLGILWVIKMEMIMIVDYAQGCSPLHCSLSRDNLGLLNAACQAAAPQ